MLIPYETKKFYYGFPIFVLGFEDENEGYNITTCSSSYSLGDMVTVGMTTDTNAAEQINKTGKFSMNFFEEDKMPMVEAAGIKHAGKKLEQSGESYEVNEELNVPILTSAKLVLLAQVRHTYSFGDYTNWVCSVEKRYLDDSLLDDKGHYAYASFTPVVYEGDHRRRVYRHLQADSYKPFGSYMRAERDSR